VPPFKDYVRVLALILPTFFVWLLVFRLYRSTLLYEPLRLMRSIAQAWFVSMLTITSILYMSKEWALSRFVLNTFALTLIIGIIVGTYSSIYVASPIVVIWKNFTNRRKLAAVPVAAPKVTASASQPPSKKKNSGR